MADEKRTIRVDEKRGGYPAGHKPADQLRPPPASVVQNPPQAPDPRRD
jgi:hypothetical protein